MAPISLLSDMFYHTEQAVLGSQHGFFRVLWVENTDAQAFTDQMIFDLHDILKPNMVPHFDKLPVVNKAF